ncbi:MAG: trehalase family glycosidase [Bacteroidales bacterium]|nr:trehalase family glycosidase [Bacteroidales bacterium]
MLTGTAAVLPIKLSAKEDDKSIEKYRLPYKNTYLKEPLVTENEYRIAKPVETKAGSFEQAKKILPNPIWQGHEKEIEMYWKAWEIGIKNIKAPETGSGFVSSYIDTAYNGNIFMWDSAFIMMFCRYGTRFFPFQQSIDNFYAKQHPDGFICREIKADGADCFERYDPTSTGPNILPWCEMVYYKQFGDMERLHKVFPVLCAYYKWLKLNHTWRNGTYWSSGWGTGMDNMPRVQPQYNMIYSHGHMIWLDACIQQLFVANLLLEMGLYLERWQEIEDFEDDAKMLSKYISEKLWDDKEGFLFDEYSDGSLSKTKGIHAYWALLTDLLDKNKMDRFVKELDNKETFNRFHRIPSLAADNPKYKENGRYWQGGVWTGATYMVVQGLKKHNYDTLAWDIAINHYNNVFEVYKKTGTFWEYYAPESADPGFMARPDFVGWTGLPPIAGLIEQIMGITADYTKKEVCVEVNLKEEYGLERYPFGPEGMINFMIKPNGNNFPTINIDSNIDFKLIVKANGKSNIYNVAGNGEQTFN